MSSARIVQVHGVLFERECGRAVVLHALRVPLPRRLFDVQVDSPLGERTTHARQQDAHATRLAVSGVQSVPDVQVGLLNSIASPLWCNIMVLSIQHKTHLGISTCTNVNFANHSSVLLDILNNANKLNILLLLLLLHTMML